MLVEKYIGKIVSKMGIKNDDMVVICDNQNN